MTTAGDTSIALRKVAEDIQGLKSAYSGEDHASCTKLLNEIQHRIILFPTFLNPEGESKSRVEELSLARDFLELGVLIAAREKDLELFESYYNQLQVYYWDVSRTELPESAQYLMLFGLNLIRLLVCSRIAEFHSELERIPSDKHGTNVYLRFAVELERYLMEGSYNKLLTSRKKVPSNEYIPVVEMLESTVRLEVADCIPETYNTLAITEAQKILMLDSEEKVRELGQEREWAVSADKKSFTFVREDNAIKREIPFKQLLEQQINFVADLQNIV